jgi:hypothetical protein
MSRILVVEDEPAIADAVEYALSTEGMTVVLITHKVGSAKYSHVGLPCICLRIPTGFRPTAQGCALRATLGKSPIE